MMVIRFPILSAVEDATVVLGVQFQTDTLRSLLERLPLQDAGATYLLDTTGRIVTTTTGAPQVASELSALLQEARDAPNGSLARTLGGVPSVIATTALGDTGWTLANVVPRTALYRRAEYVGLVLLLVSVAAIALGALAVVAISLRIYTPIGKLLRKVRSLEGPKVTHTGKGTTDELAVLGYAIDDLSTRMEELSTTVEANRVVIKHDLVTRLLSGAVTTMEEYAEAARLLGLGALHPWYRAALLMLVTDRGATSPGEARLLAYRAADQVERTGQGHVLAAAMPDGTVGMAVAESEAGQEAHRLAQTWAEPGFLSVPVRVILGCPVNVPTDLAASFAEALRVAPYAFFYTERTILHDAGDLLAREEPFSAAARTIREAFPEKLRLRRRNEVVQALGAACALVRVDHASAEVGVSVLKAISAGILEYAKDMKLEAAAPTLQGAHDLVDASRDVDDFLSRATALVDQIYAALNARANGRTSAHVEAAKQYVQEHYATALSLDRAAEVAGVSASYLSKVFRAETGVTFVSWVSAFRLERAERLLRDADKPVHEIGSSCGMNTPAYFIRQFKARYGLTPFDYRRAYRTGGPVR
jgi:AraC-like DNA-binding protein